MNKCVIGLTGFKGSGKDTAAWPLLDYGFKLIKFADPLKNMVRSLLRSAGLVDSFIERCVEGDMKEVPLECLEGKSTRYVMQTLGAEFGRNLIGDCLWVNLFKRRAANHDLVVCTDVRYSNEVDTIHSMGGEVWRIVRPSITNGQDNHSSETSISGLSVDLEIINDWSVAQLHANIREALRGM